jgi:hypothetical protein
VPDLVRVKVVADGSDANDLEAERSYEDMLAHPETVVDAFDLFDSIPTCTSCQKPDNSVGDVGSAGVCATRDHS